MKATKAEEMYLDEQGWWLVVAGEHKMLIGAGVDRQEALGEAIRQGYTVQTGDVELV